MAFKQRKGADFKYFHKSMDSNIQRKPGHTYRSSHYNDAFDYSQGAKKRKMEQSGSSKDYSQGETKDMQHLIHKQEKQKHRQKSLSVNRYSKSRISGNNDSNNSSDVASDSERDTNEDVRTRDTHKVPIGFPGSAGTVLTDSNSDDSESGTFDDDDDVDEDGMEEEEGTGDQKKNSDEYEALKKELAEIPLEDLMKVKEKIGLKVFNKVMHGSKGKSPRPKRTFKRANKHRPREISSRRQVPVVRQPDNLSLKHTFHRDPRFDDLSGEYKDEYFEKNYAFIDDIKNKEKKMVKKELKKTEETSKKKELQGLLMRMNQQEQVRENKRKKKAIESTWKSKEKDMVKQGKLPYFLKKSEKKKLELAEKYKELQQSGKLEQYLSKKRKKNAQRERKKLPQNMNSKK